MVPNIEIEEVGELTAEDLLASISPDPLPEVYITVVDYMRHNNCCHATALRDLEAKVREGVLQKQRARVDGRERWIFF